ncbi:putative periplasmic serine endoprotease DegP-like [Methylocella tundrae]|uniref:Probable periplasmic serine endoprotease DegP-like n=1 Tax=Methylocella tundrae TaxID=227605 RepID=A0A8B6M2G7_METTU|nr:Do family serine endopeptidase [Methylocella tundrae]VTZ48974.1 putative periplasmic serine endoprotease DegP-like [Methylocella tundrae]
MGLIQNIRRRAFVPAPRVRSLSLKACSALALAGALSLGAGGGILPVLETPSAFAKGPDSLADLAASISDTVVNISATQTMDEKRAGNAPQMEPGTPFDDLFEEFFRRRQQGQRGPDQPAPRTPHERRSNSLGSGFVIDPSGLIITNNHVIADANEVTVIFTDGQKLKAEVVGKDEKVDVAVLRVKPDKPLKAAKFGDSDKMRVGDWVVAVGNPFGLGGTVTAGIISARNRNIDSGPYDNYFQTDAAINKGNSGGPLFNMDGEVIGINTAILSPSGGSIGIGFSTPAATVMPVIDQLEKYGETRRGWLGVRIQNVDDTIAETLNLGSVRGALIAGTDEKGPAKAAGLEAGDVILKFDGIDIKESHDLPKIVASAPVGKDVEIVLLRQGKQITKTIKLGRLEDNEKQLASLTVQKSDADKPKTTSTVEKALGMEFSSLSDGAREKYSIKSSVGSGVVVTSVDPDSGAADKHIQSGEVILEINQEPVKEPVDVAKKLAALKNDGKKSALLLVANGQGEMRFVALPFQ